MTFALVLAGLSILTSTAHASEGGVSWCPGVPVLPAPTKLPLSINPEGNLHVAWEPYLGIDHFNFNIQWSIKGSPGRIGPTGNEWAAYPSSTTQLNFPIPPDAYAVLINLAAVSSCSQSAIALWRDEQVTLPSLPAGVVPFIDDLGIGVPLYSSPTDVSYRVTLLPTGQLCELSRATSATLCRFNGLKLGSTYSVQIQGVNALGSGPVATFGPYIYAKGPNAPRRVAVKTVTTSSARISWLAPKQSSASRYGGNTITGYSVVAVPGGATCQSTTTQCTVSGLTPGTTYRFQVRAQNAAHSSMPTASKPITTVFAPLAPTVVAEAAKPLPALN